MGTGLKNKKGDMIMCCVFCKGKLVPAITDYIEKIEPIEFHLSAVQ